MTGGDADIWVCGNCRSVNKLRAKQCYSCRTPQHLASVDPADILATGHGALREIALPEFRSSRGEAMLASVLILLVAGLNIVSTVVASQVLRGMLDDPNATIEGVTADLIAAGSISLATLGVGILALTAWAFWLSRVVVAMPALGLGYPAANGTMAFVENFLPGLNLFRVPAIVRDVVRRVEPAEGRGEALIFAAWIGLLGGFFVPRIGGFLGLFAGDTVDTVAAAIRNQLVVEGVAAGLVLVGAVFLVALIWWIEARIARRRAAQLAGEVVAAAAPEGAAVPVEAPTPTTVAPYMAPDAVAPVAAVASVAPVTPVTPVAPVAPFAPPPGRDAVAPDAPAVTSVMAPAVQSPTPPVPIVVARPPAATPAPLSTDALLHRPITAVTGAASIPTPAEAPTLAPEPTFAAEAAPAPAPAPEPSREPTSEPVYAPRPAPVPASPAEPTSEPAAAARVPTGPRLHLRIESATSMIATLDGESEAITLDEIRAATAALARADGSAVIQTVATTFEARGLADQVLEAFADAGIPTTLED